MGVLTQAPVESVAGTIRIECSGAYIGNDILLGRSQSMLSSSSSLLSSSPRSQPVASPSPVTSEDEDDYMSSSCSSIVLSSTHKVIYDTTRANQIADDDLTKNITLPRHTSDLVHISVDIGGTLTKLVYFTKSAGSGGKLHFKDFQTEDFKTEVLKFMIKLVKKSVRDPLQPPITYIMATGGGAHKFYQLMKSSFAKQRLPMKIHALDEMECLIRGLDWLVTKIPHEIFTYDLNEDDTVTVPQHKIDGDDSIYPYLLVNIGSGVSMIKVTGPGPEGYERIGGSSLGGGTLWGLLSLLTDANDYNEMLEMAQRGDNGNVDLLVGDIYGTSYNKIGLKSTHIASSFAKVFKKLRFSQKKFTAAEKLQQFRQEDIARSLLYSISNNIGQIAYLQACRFNLQRIYFGGSYISGHKQTIHTLSYAVNFWSKGAMQSYFLRHEGYLGSVGAFMMGPTADMGVSHIECERMPNNV
ncbi:pantothenate kinase Cab1p [Diutina catenulata]